MRGTVLFSLGSQTHLWTMKRRVTIRKVRMLSNAAARKKALSYQQKLLVVSSFDRKDSVPSRKMATKCMNNKIYTSFIVGLCGMDAFIVGKKATKARINVAIVASLLLRDGSWKKTNNPMAPRI